MNIRELHFGTMMLLPDDVVLLKFKDGIKVDIDEAKEIVLTTIDMAEGRPFRSLVDARDIFSSMDSEASSSSLLVLAEAATELPPMENVDVDAHDSAQDELA